MDAKLQGPEESDVKKVLSGLENARISIVRDLRILETANINTFFTRAIDNERAARARISRAESRIGRARLAESHSKAIHDAARRAAAEILDERLDRVLPLNG